MLLLLGLGCVHLQQILQATVKHCRQYSVLLYNGSNVTRLCRHLKFLIAEMVCSSNEFLVVSACFCFFFSVSRFSYTSTLETMQPDVLLSYLLCDCVRKSDLLKSVLSKILDAGYLYVKPSDDEQNLYSLGILGSSVMCYRVSCQQLVYRVIN